MFYLWHQPCSNSFNFSSLTVRAGIRAKIVRQVICIVVQGCQELEKSYLYWTVLPNFEVEKRREEKRKRKRKRKKREEKEKRRERKDKEGDEERKKDMKMCCVFLPALGSCV